MPGLGDHASARGLHALAPVCALAAMLLALFAPEGNASDSASERPNLEGVWVPVLVAFDDPRWRIADLVCARTGCSVAGFDYLQSLLAKPENRNRRTGDLVKDMEAYQVQVNERMLTPMARQSQAEFDPSQEASLDCKPDGDGLRHQVLAPLPIEIEQQEDRVILRYEYWNAERIVYLNGTEPGESVASSRLGYSTGRYEGNSLIVESSRLLPSMTGIPNGNPVLLTADARAVERYTLSGNGDVLDVMMEIIDPANFTEPYQDYRRLLNAPGWELDNFVCESITGEF